MAQQGGENPNEGLEGLEQDNCNAYFFQTVAGSGSECQKLRVLKQILLLHGRFVNISFQNPGYVR